MKVDVVKWLQRAAERRKTNSSSHSMMGPTEVIATSGALFVQEVCESSSEIFWQRSRVLALNGLQADKLEPATATDIIF